MDLLKFFRKLPTFQGKMKLANLLAKSSMNSSKPITFKAGNNLIISIPNSTESVGKELLVDGKYEPETVKLILELLPNESLFFDVGANIGAITLPVAKSANCYVHSFEPSKFTFEYLEKNVLQNHLNNVTLNNNAVHSIHDLELQFFDSKEKNGNSSLSCTYANQPHYIVKTISLDTYCKEKGIPFINVLKIDVQGYEIEVLKGAEDLLQKKLINYIIFEMEAWAENQAGYEVGASQEFLIEHGYELFSLAKKPINSIYREGSHMFLAKPIGSNGFITNS